VTAARPRGGRAIEALLDSLPQLSLVVGKGGVGKTTCAAGIAARLAARGNSTLLVSTDPAGSLGSVVGVSLTAGERREVDVVPGLSVLQLDARGARMAFLARRRDTIVTIVDRGTYLDLEDINGLVDAALPGADEIFALLALADLLAETRGSAIAPRWERLVVDTAPTGHTLRLLALPETFDAMIGLLEAMQAKHRFMVSALTRRYRRDAADEFLAAMRSAVSGLRSSFGDRSHAAALLVTRAEEVVVNETLRYAEALRALGVAVAAIIVNAVAAPRDAAVQAILQSLDAVMFAGAQFTLPRDEPPPVGLQAIEGLMGRMEVRRSGAPSKEKTRRMEKGLRAGAVKAVSSFSGGAPRAGARGGAIDPGPLSLLRTLTIVGGKGGVGKTTVACALAIAAAHEDGVERDVLLVSTDPAPSIGDALGIDAPQWAHRAPEPVDQVPRLVAWQMDATSAFGEFRERYRDRIDELFEAWIGRGIDATHDRAILRDLLALAPPGIDELYALSSIGEALDEERYANIIIDPAPTGHLLRLLEMPALALDWTRRLMRLILKYRDIAGLGDAPQELVNFSRRTRTLDNLLHDATRAGVVLVSLVEPVVLTESARLAKALREVGVAVLGTLLNRVVESEPGAAEFDWPRPLLAAPEAERPLIGARAIDDWCRRWRRTD
jgi:arsenite-transporting ATPase